ncbi:hypothetical protein [Salinibaculum rarum]|uniref:hypothetical protein n=1 Tax=Salinibaculum rarum TaxID=3058903 RepID=UPI00265DA88B|nr:hypothetical protein [Salinibaculum sp. KK48]
MRMRESVESQSVNRRDVLKWDNPHREISHLSWYNPLLWVFVAIDLVILVRWYWWHKRQSKRADRTALAMNLAFALQDCEFIKTNADTPRENQKRAEELQDKLQHIADELNLESGTLARHRTDRDTTTTGE